MYASSAGGAAMAVTYKPAATIANERKKAVQTAKTTARTRRVNAKRKGGN